jgi:hypothetical protein
MVGVKGVKVFSPPNMCMMPFHVKKDDGVVVLCGGEVVLFPTPNTATLTETTQIQTRSFRALCFIRGVLCLPVDLTTSVAAERQDRHGTIRHRGFFRICQVLYEDEAKVHVHGR